MEIQPGLLVANRPPNQRISPADLIHYSFATDPGSDSALQQKKRRHNQPNRPTYSVISLQSERNTARLFKVQTPHYFSPPFNSHYNSTSINHIAVIPFPT
jgi:hypothetical protein